MAERQGFEPWVRFTARRFSRPVPSTTRSSLQICCTFGDCLWHFQDRYLSLRSSAFLSPRKQAYGDFVRLHQPLGHLSKTLATIAYHPWLFQGCCSNASTATFLAPVSRSASIAALADAPVVTISSHSTYSTSSANGRVEMKAVSA